LQSPCRPSHHFRCPAYNITVWALFSRITTGLIKHDSRRCPSHDVAPVTIFDARHTISPCGRFFKKHDSLNMTIDVRCVPALLVAIVALLELNYLWSICAFILIPSKTCASELQTHMCVFTSQSLLFQVILASTSTFSCCTEY